MAADAAESSKSCTTPVTVTHFSWNEAGKIEQRVITRSSSPGSSLPMSITSEESSSLTSSNNPFTSLLSIGATPATTTVSNNGVSAHKETSTNPFLNSNPFSQMNGANGKDEVAKKPAPKSEEAPIVAKSKVSFVIFKFDPRGSGNL